MNLFFISIVEAIYIFYMYNYFYTTWYIHHPFELWLQDEKIHQLLKHPVSSEEYDSKICPLGNLVGILLPIWIMIRYFYKNKRIIRLLNKIIWITVFFTSLFLNMNAFIYLLPVYLAEFFYIQKTII